ncbi:hypothetical protein CBS9595_002195 [Malassezia furfur]|nr:hypothetical protein CBS9595_002195 [Malassezia furfur]
MATDRYAAERAVLGDDALERLRQARMLVVGAGGIGSEVLKDLVLLGVGHIEIKPKAHVAKASASAFNPDVKIVAHHANVQGKEFDVAFYQSFDVVLSALDNLATRRYVNRMQLFGEDDEAGDAELDEAARSGENAQELENLRREAHQMRALRTELNDTPHDAACKIFAKVFDVDIQRLLSMDDMWEQRTRPTPLTLETAREDTHVPEQTEALKDRQTLSLADTAQLFLDSTEALAKRAQSSSAPLAFDKDDTDALAFVTTASNLRAHVYHIPRKTQFETKQIAGNIIPAIATTNAIVSGLAVVQALHMLAERWDAMRMVSMARHPARAFTTFPPAPPNPACGVCNDMYLVTDVRVDETTLGDVLDVVRKATSEGGLAYDEDAEVSIADGARILYDPDLEDNLGKTLAELRVDVGTALSVVDEDAQKATVQLLLHTGDAKAPHVRWPGGRAEEVRARREVPKPASDSESDVEAVEAPPPAAAAPRHGRKRRASDAGVEVPAKRKVSDTTDAPQGSSEDAAIVLD